MELKNIKHLKTKDLLPLILYSFLGLGLPMLILMSILILAGVPVIINGVEKHGIEGFIYGLLFTPIAMGLTALVFWLYTALGWKIARWFLRIIGKV